MASFWQFKTSRWTVRGHLGKVAWALAIVLTPAATAQVEPPGKAIPAVPARPQADAEEGQAATPPTPKQPAAVNFYFQDGKVRLNTVDGRVQTLATDAVYQVNSEFRHVRFVRVAAGDTIEKVAAWHSVDAKRLRQLNRVSAGHVYTESAPVCLEWRHQVQNGQTLAGIARLYSMTVDQLAELNGIQPTSAVEEKQVLMVAGRYKYQRPRKARPGGIYIWIVQNNLAGRRTTYERHSTKTHQVQDGETLATIAKKYKVTPKFLQRLNQLAPADTLFPGDTLAIASTIRIPPEIDIRDVAFHLGVDLQDILILNGLDAISQIQTDQELHVPVDLVRQQNGLPAADGQHALIFDF